MAVSEEMGAGLMWCGFGCGGVVLVVVEGAGGRFAVGRLRAGGGELVRFCRLEVLLMSASDQKWHALSLGLVRLVNCAIRLRSSSLI